VTDDCPRIRPLDIIPVQSQGRQAFLLRDPQGISPHQLVVPADIAYLLSQLDGTRTVREVQVSYVRRFGALLTTDRIGEILQRLDEALLLDTERFREFRRAVEAEFRARPTRAAAHAGRSYEAAAAAFARSWQPRLEAAGQPAGFRLDSNRPAFIAPHYDMDGAAECYASAYALLAAVERPDVVVILGIAHSGQAPFALTRKPFETPFGALDTDPEIIDRLARDAPLDLFADEFAHRDEHSIEFQAVLLHHVYREQSDPPVIVPILCGGYHRLGDGASDPRGMEHINRFLDLLRDVLAADSRRLAVIASADLSHIGTRFGGPPINQVHLDLARRHDLALLERAQAGDADGLYRVFAEAGDRYNVCGFPAIYALLRALPLSQGRLLSYRQAVEAQTHSCVSFASVALRPGP